VFSGYDDETVSVKQQIVGNICRVEHKFEQFFEYKFANNLESSSLYNQIGLESNDNLVEKDVWSVLSPYEEYFYLNNVIPNDQFFIHFCIHIF
jgi:hypothetical protein